MQRAVVNLKDANAVCALGAEGMIAVRQREALRVRLVVYDSVADYIRRAGARAGADGSRSGNDLGDVAKARYLFLST